MANNKTLLVEDVCKELKLGRTTVYRMIKNKKIPAAYIGRKYLIKQVDLENYLNEARNEIKDREEI